MSGEELRLQRQLVGELERRGYAAGILPTSGDTDVAIYGDGDLVALIEVKLQMICTSGNWGNLYSALGQVLFHAHRRQLAKPLVLAICAHAESAVYVQGDSGFWVALNALKVNLFYYPLAEGDPWLGLDEVLRLVDERVGQSAMPGSKLNN